MAPLQNTDGSMPSNPGEAPLSRVRDVVVSVTLAIASAPPGPAPAPAPSAVAVPAATFPSVCANSADGATTIAMAVASDGTVYAATGYHVVRRFDPGARGDVAPNASLCSAFGDVGNVDALAVTNDSLYAVSDGAIRQFARAASESQQPVKLIGSATDTDNATGLSTSEGGPQQVAIGPDKTIYVLFAQHANGGCSAIVDVFAPSALGDVGPVGQLAPAIPGFPRTVGGHAVCATPSSIAVDSRSQLYTLFDDGTIVRSIPASTSPGVRVARVRLGENANDRSYRVSGLHLAQNGIGTLFVGAGRTITIVRTLKKNLTNTVIRGPRTGLSAIFDIAVDGANRIYVLDCSRAGAAIIVFAPTASGNAEPVWNLAGPDTRMTCAYRRQ